MAAAAFTFLMALSSISGATIANPDVDKSDDPIYKEPVDLKSKENAVYSPSKLSLTYLNYQNMIEKYNPSLNHNSRDNIYESAVKASQQYNVPLELIIAVMGCESQFKPQLRGALDDTGLMQVRFKFTSSWANAMGKKPPTNQEALASIDYNISMGTFILSYLLDTFDNDLHKALTAYNAGEYYVKRKLSNEEALPETYIKRVNSFYQQITNAALW